MKRRLSGFFAAILILSIILPLAAGSGVSADASSSDDFITALLETGSAELPFEVSIEVYENISAKTGSDDTAKTYMFTGAPKDKLSSGVQHFENGRYEEGVFTPDYKALADYLERALVLYKSLEGSLTEDCRVRARAVIDYAFGRLPLNERLYVDGAPYWLTGADHSELYLLEYAEESYVTVSTGGFCIPVYPDEVSDTEFYAKKIRNDGGVYSHGLLFDVIETSEIKISVPQDASHFTATLSVDTSCAGTKVILLSAVAYVTDSTGTESEFATYSLRKGYECRIDIPLEDAQRIRFAFYADTDASVLGCIMGDAIFLADDDDPDVTAGGAVSRVGDVNGDGVVNLKDAEMLPEVILGNADSDPTGCDTDMNGKVDLADLLSLENYLIYVRNTDREHNKARSQFFAVALGDSIARGSGLDSAEFYSSSAFAYAALVPQYIKNSTGYDLEFTNYGTDGATLSDLLTSLENNNMVRSSVQNADLITVSIGGNDFIQAFVGILGEKYAMSFAGIPEAFTYIVANEDPIEFLGYLLSDEIIAEFEADALSRSATLERIGALLRELNPDAEIMLTTVPNTAVDSTFVVSFDMGGLGASEIPLFNVNKLFESWLTPYNEMIIASDGECFEVVDSREIFKGDHSLSLMDIDEKVNVSDIASGNYSAVRHFDIHPSEEGHRAMASCHTALLDTLIAELSANYSEESVTKEEYSYSPTTSKSELALSTSLTPSDDGKLIYKVTVARAQLLENLLVNINYDAGCLSLESIEQASVNGARISDREGGVILLVKGADSYPQEIALELTFISVSPEDTETSVSASAEEVRITVDGVQRITSQRKDTVQISAAESDQTDGSADGLLDWLDENGGLLGWLESNNGVFGWLFGDEGLFGFVLGNKSSGKVIAYTVFVLAALLLGAAILIVVAFVTARSKKNKNKTNKSERGNKK